MRVSQFITNESGAVTVDWVVLSAAIVGLGLTTVAAVRGGVNALGSDVSTSLTDASVAQLDFGGEPVVDNYGGACGGTPEYPVMDCGTVWTFPWDDIVNINGTDYFVNADGAIIDEFGDAMPLMINGYMDGMGNFVTDGPYDIAGRLVDGNGVPI